MQWITRVASAFISVLGSMSVAGAAVPEPRGEPKEVIEIAVDAGELPGTRKDIAAVVEAELQRALSEQEPLPPGVFVADDRRVLIELRRGPIPETDDVLIRIEAQLEGVTLGESATETCLSCTNENVAQKALPMLRPLLGTFPEPGQAELPAAPPPAMTADSGGGEITCDRTCGLLITGASLLGVGMVSFGAGFALAVVDQPVVSAPGTTKLEVAKHQKPGIAIAVVGQVAAATGATLLGVVLGQRERPRLTANPVITADRWGVTLGGYF